MTAPSPERLTPSPAGPPVPAPMPEGRADAVVASVGLAAFALAYLAVSLFHPPLPLYDPAHRLWRLGRHATGLWMGYFGQVAFAFAASALLVALARPIARRRPPGAALARVLFLVAFAVGASAVGFYIHAFFHAVG